ncbi:TRAP transporter small permease [Celeribacter halophilus]|jgi:TRAP-type C4-dicarboxylate transport system permease small subunit|uniref:TRAP transporter small permease protein n=1 Tax=Celeribacter halophilus TaxID=576117 RepID=A0A1I3UAH9_9RHOB|nr:TRAP transporter small permease [Celeribacter halophilus]MBU2888794.1 TRAP transporter small permease [Celeribacter halophilus]MDO6458788.1 TRAP transporter small permease [Celeribacter halophilus]MDO6511789.1 TRAP transporter small permease [Celeribacter halophilus]MDO6724571.1 TRAP transporter small permease [Celeribacter halophilus]PZX10240.1 TRAP-type C4-dicarboxylate transport system permease small subunit [Celeribacter halophilus]
MARIIDLFYRLLDLVMILLLAGMAVMVFLNVVLRYGLNSGIPVSEELSRFFFVWLTFIGAVVAHRHNMHMGMETFVAALGRRGRMLMMGVSDLLILGCSWVLFLGTWKQLPINASMTAPVSGLSMAWVYGTGMFTAVMIALITATRFLRLVTGRITEDEIAAFAGERHQFDETPASGREGGAQ